jgi:hypothetical protein
MFWPVGEAAQADYETLRAHLLDTGTLPDSLAAARFLRRGLAGLIAWPAAEPVFTAELTGACRPPWTPHADPRLDALAVGYGSRLSKDMSPPRRRCRHEGGDLRAGVHRRPAGPRHDRIPAGGTA